MTRNHECDAIAIVIASNNAKKAHEMRSLLPETVKVLTAEQAGVTLPAETGSTFEENALLKARAAASQSRMIAVADDSGLVVDALDGRPGVRSARFAEDAGRPATDHENNQLLIELLEGVPAGKRSARFISAVAVVSPRGDEQVFHGVVEGSIGYEPRGEGGFGYDPLFYPESDSRTLAEFSPDEKNRMSHRGRALRSAMPEILSLTSQKQVKAPD